MNPARIGNGAGRVMHTKVGELAMSWRKPHPSSPGGWPRRVHHRARSAR